MSPSDYLMNFKFDDRFRIPRVLVEQNCFAYDDICDKIDCPFYDIRSACTETATAREILWSHYNERMSKRDKKR